MTVSADCQFVGRGICNHLGDKPTGMSVRYYLGILSSEHMGEAGATIR